mmetsp:Transcript_43410/g.88817  ORF Transcript_43410/g.88817 Transcript_43410/m.88817 type:complete len:231 (+) Transcript_43410:1406-2098(+)
MRDHGECHHHLLRQDWHPHHREDDRGQGLEQHDGQPQHRGHPLLSSLLSSGDAGGGDGGEHVVQVGRGVGQEHRPSRQVCGQRHGVRNAAAGQQADGEAGEHGQGPVPLDPRQVSARGPGQAHHLVLLRPQADEHVGSKERQVHSVHQGSVGDCAWALHTGADGAGGGGADSRREGEAGDSHRRVCRRRPAHPVRRLPRVRHKAGGSERGGAGGGADAARALRPRGPCAR